MKNPRLKPGEVDLHRRRQYWEMFEKDKIVSDAGRHAEREAGIRFACWMLVDELRPDSKRMEWAKEKADLFAPLKNLGGAPDAAQKYFDEHAPKALEKFMEEGRKGRKVVREDEHGPYKTTVGFF